jgi:hypothetical protein
MPSRTAHKARKGRPPVDPTKLLSRRLHTNLTAEEAEAVERAAAADDRDVSTWLRRAAKAFLLPREN